MFKKGFFLSTLAAVSIFADQPPTVSDETWFTGPLITPASAVVGQGHYNIEPYFIVMCNSGVYNSSWKPSNLTHLNTAQTIVPIQVGATPWMEVQISPQISYQSTQKIANLGINDLPLAINFQLMRQELGTWKPNLKLFLKATAPLGKFDKLDPLQLTTDDFGGGSWLPGANLIFGKLFHVGKNKFVSIRGGVLATFGNTISVKGYNNYGGGYLTDGKVNIGATYTGLFALEYNFTRRWVFACDFVYKHANKITFKGSPGWQGLEGPIASVGAPSSEQFSIAPALEYNFNKHVGIIAGSWFTLLGRNANVFRSGMAAVNVYY